MQHICYQFVILASVSTIVLTLGCGSPPVADAEDKSTASNMAILHRAYLEYWTQNEKAPSNKEDLLPLISDEHKNSAFVSSRDNEPYVVYWDTPIDFSQTENPTIIAHEKTGSDGKRFAFSSYGLTEMTNSAFKKAGLPRN